MNTPTLLRPDVDATVQLLLPDGRREYLGLHEWPSRAAIDYLRAMKREGKPGRVAVIQDGVRTEVAAVSVDITAPVVECRDMGRHRVKPLLEIHCLAPVFSGSGTWRCRSGGRWHGRTGAGTRVRSRRTDGLMGAVSTSGRMAAGTKASTTTGAGTGAECSSGRMASGTRGSTARARPAATG